MKSTGIVRKIDDLGRVVLPMELRKILSISAKDAIEVYIEDKQIVLEKYLSSEDIGSVGIVRKIDDLGRVVIPKEVRKVLRISPKDDIEVYTEERRIILKKYSFETNHIEELKCCLCSNVTISELRKHKNTIMCVNCLKSFK